MIFKFKSLFFYTIICINNVVNGEDLTDLIDFTCNTTVDCSQFNQAYQNVTCLDNKCTCYKDNSMEVKCSPPDGSFYNNIIGGNCPCTQEFSECKKETQICYCQKGYIATLDKRRCIKKTLQLGENCENDSQCIYQEKFSECDLKEKICKCQKDFVEFNDGCISVVGLNDHCESNDQCQNKTENSICALKKCACNIGFVSNLEKTKCLPGVEYNNDCKEDNQCKLELGVGSICYSGKCLCDIKHQLLEVKSEQKNETQYTCEKDVHFGDYCYEHNDCYRYKEDSGHQSMKCFHGECACRPDFVAVNKTCILNAAPAKRISTLFVILITITFMILAAVIQPNGVSKSVVLY